MMKRKSRNSIMRKWGLQLFTTMLLAALIAFETATLRTWRKCWKYYFATFTILNILLFVIGWFKAVKEIGWVVFVWLGKTCDHVTNSGEAMKMAIRKLILSYACGLVVCEDDHFPLLIKH